MNQQQTTNELHNLLSVASWVNIFYGLEFGKKSCDDQVTIPKIGQILQKA